MSKTMRAVKWFREVCVLAEDEQRRAGHPEIDVEHLFLALLSAGGPVTDAIAAQGVTLPRAREAFARLRSQHAAALGVHLPPSEAGRRIPEHNARGFRFKPGVRKLLESAAAQHQADVALFAALRREPSGHIAEILRALGIESETLALPEDAGGGEERFGSAARGRAREYRRYVPASPQAVWGLIADPRRWLEWNGFEFDRAEVGETGIVRAHARERNLEGKPVRIASELRVSEFVVSRFDAPTLIQWERSFPDAPKPVLQSLRISLAPVGAGTEVTVAFTQAGSSVRKASPRLQLLGPVVRLLEPLGVRGYLRGKADNISRALRQ